MIFGWTLPLSSGWEHFYRLQCEMHVPFFPVAAFINSDGGLRVKQRSADQSRFLKCFFFQQFLIWSRSRSNRRQILVLPQWTSNRLPINEAGKKNKNKTGTLQAEKMDFYVLELLRFLICKRGEKKLTSSHFCSATPRTDTDKVYLYTYIHILWLLCMYVFLQVSWEQT